MQTLTTYGWGTGGTVKVGDLVIHKEKGVGIITHLWVGGSAAVLFSDGEYDVDEDDLEVINETR